LPNHQSVKGATSPAQPCTNIGSTPGASCKNAARIAPGYSASHSRVIPPIVIGCAVKLITAASGEPSSPSTRITLTASSTGRSWRTRLTLSPGARVTAEPTRAGFILFHAE